MHLRKLVKELKNCIDILVGQGVLKIWIKAVKMFQHQYQGCHQHQVSELPPAEDSDGYHRNIRIKHVSVVDQF